MVVEALLGAIAYVSFFLGLTAKYHYGYLNNNREKIKEKVYEDIDTKLEAHMKMSKVERKRDLKKLIKEIRQSVFPLQDTDNGIQKFKKDMLVASALCVVSTAGATVLVSTQLFSFLAAMAGITGLLIFYSFIGLLVLQDKIKKYLEDGEKYER